MLIQLPTKKKHVITHKLAPLHRRPTSYIFRRKKRKKKEIHSRLSVSATTALERTARVYMPPAMAPSSRRTGRARYPTTAPLGHFNLMSRARVMRAPCSPLVPLLRALSPGLAACARWITPGARRAHAARLLRPHNRFETRFSDICGYGCWETQNLVGRVP